MQHLRLHHQYSLLLNDLATVKELLNIKSGSIRIIHLSDLPLCSLRSLWLNHADATVNDII
jgi:hypothetical protein